MPIDAPQLITKAVPHIRLAAANTGKLTALDQLASVYQPLCQQYVTLFCVEEVPDSFRTPCFPTLLSERWHRVAIQQAAGIAKSWRSNRATVYQEFLDALAEYQEHEHQDEQQQRQQAEDPMNAEMPSLKTSKLPVWREWAVPTLQHQCIQANVNVARLEVAHDSTFDYWLIISTLEARKTLHIPLTLASYHLGALTDSETGQRRTLNSSVTLNKRDGVWWLTLTYDETITVQTVQDAPVIGLDVGIANFLTASDGKQYGTLHGKLRERQQRDREKRRRKAKLRACLEKKGVSKEKLPSTSNATGQRLCRHVRQEINHAVKQCFVEHEGSQFAYEQLSVASMRFKAKAMNAYLYASNLAYIPKQITWNARKRGVIATAVQSAYSSQECAICHSVDRKNRQNQQTFCCQACGHTAHADHNAAQNLAMRIDDEELSLCRTLQEIKTVLLQRHEYWKQHQRIVVVDPPV